MKAIIMREMKDNRKSLLIWMVAMLGIIAIGAGEYPIVMEAGDALTELLESLPHVLAIIFGAESLPITTPLGYYIMLYLWYCMIAFTHAAVLGASIITKEERHRTAEFIFTKPFTREAIITSKIIAAVVNVAIMTMTAWLGTVITLVPQFQGESILGEITSTILAMFLIQILFLFLGLLNSAIFPDYKKALSISAAIVILSYTLMVIIELVETIDFLSILTPFMYFKGPSLIQDGFSMFYLLLTIVIITTACYFTYSIYRRRDLHN